MSEIQNFRRQVDDFMGKHPQSPLGYQGQRAFSGLNYYEPTEAFVIEAEVVPFPDNEPTTTMQTSTGDQREYRRYAELRFEVDGEQVALTVYSDPAGHDLFLPFKDKTNGADTYGAGRYLDNHRPGLQFLNSTTMEINFNYAYNPYCAYNDGYSCPLPPRENWLKVEIQAGEKDFNR